MVHLCPVAHCFALIIWVFSFILLTYASSGCGSESPWTFNSKGHANVSLDDRSFLVHIPASYALDEAYPVVISFHGYGDTPHKQEMITGFSEDGVLINNKGIISVYPLGALGPGKHGIMATSWQGAPYSKAGIDDVAFTQRIVQELQTNLCIDSKRLYASGKSNGGGFTNLLACTNSTAKLFAAFAPVSAALYPGVHPIQDCNPGHAVQLINFHGLADTVIPFVGASTPDPAYDLPNITVYREDWAIRNGCQSTIPSSTTHPLTDTTLKEWNCSASSAVVKGYTVSGLGHSWPGTLGLDGDVTDFNATTAAIIPFFDNYTLK